jgi:DNA polymerase III delta subunit
MITIYHGQDLVSSRKAFVSQKDKNSVTFDAININLVEFSQSASGSSLFAETKSIFLENLFNRKAAKNYDQLIELIKKAPKETNIHIWSDKDLTKKGLSDLGEYSDREFKIPQNIFGFLDGIRPSYPKNVLNFHEVIKTAEVEIVFFMIIRQFRLLLGILGDSKENIDEVKKLATWQKTKLQRQASLFGEEQLKKIYKKIYKIDKSVKTGRTNLSLAENIDIFLLDI